MKLTGQRFTAAAFDDDAFRPEAELCGLTFDRWLDQREDWELLRA